MSEQIHQPIDDGTGNTASSDSASTQPGGNPNQAGRWSSLGAAGTAIFASACCWLPLLLLAFGLTAGGVAGFFEDLRPYLLVIAALLLGVGFYFAYFHKPACKPGDACATPNPRAQRFNRSMLWVATVFVIVFALFPYFVGWFVPAGGSSSATAGAAAPANVELTTYEYEVEGMTCVSCAIPMERSIADTPGVGRARLTEVPVGGILEHSAAGIDPAMLAAVVAERRRDAQRARQCCREQAMADMSLPHHRRRSVLVHRCSSLWT